MCSPASAPAGPVDRSPVLPAGIRAVTLDIDSVLTDLSQVQAVAWAAALDGCLASYRLDGWARGFDPRTELSPFVDGAPAARAVGAFLASRGIDFADARTALRVANGLAARQQTLVGHHLRRHGVGVRRGAAELLHGLRERGIAVAAVSPTARARRLLDAGRLAHLVDVVLDGDDRCRLHLAPRPAPALLLTAARALGAGPGETAAVDASPNGIAAARRGGFGRIVGLTAPGDLDGLTGLFHRGADHVVHDLGELLGTGGPVPAPAA